MPRSETPAGKALTRQPHPQGESVKAARKWMRKPHPQGESVKATPKWMRLDNAALIYPAVMNRNWAALFRVSAELTEPVDPIDLREAVARVMKRFPFFSVRLRRGMFWFYLEHTDTLPDVAEDVGYPCRRMRPDKGGAPALRVCYYNKRIAAEFFHVLTDGTGGLVFLQTLVAEYLALHCGAVIPRGGMLLSCGEPPRATEAEDGFSRNVGQAAASRREPMAYRIRGTDESDGYINVTCGAMDAALLRQKAREKGVSLTQYLTAVLILCIDGMQRKTVPQRFCSPVKVCVPVNLRRFFQTGSLRNFSSYVNPGIDPRLGVYSFDETLSAVHHFMAMEATAKPLLAKITTNVLTERNPVLRVMPLFIKNAAMRLVYSRVGDRVSSTCLSNLGAVALPPEMERHVTRMDFILGPLASNRVCAAALSCKGTLRINFTRTIEEAELERAFFSRLVELGIPVTIESNQR